MVLNCYVHFQLKDNSCKPCEKETKSYFWYITFLHNNLSFVFQSYVNSLKHLGCESVVAFYFGLRWSPLSALFRFQNTWIPTISFEPFAYETLEPSKHVLFKLCHCFNLPFLLCPKSIDALAVLLFLFWINSEHQKKWEERKKTSAYLQICPLGIKPFFLVKLFVKFVKNR